MKINKARFTIMGTFNTSIVEENARQQLKNSVIRTILHGIDLVHSVIHLKSINMKVIAGILIVLGIIMIVIRGFNVQTEKKVVDIGPVEINRKQNNWIGWPTYAGAIAIGAGVIILLANKKR